MFRASGAIDPPAEEHNHHHGCQDVGKAEIRKPSWWGMLLNPKGKVHHQSDVWQDKTKDESQNFYFGFHVLTPSKRSELQVGYCSQRLSMILPTTSECTFDNESGICSASGRNNRSRSPFVAGADSMLVGVCVFPRVAASEPQTLKDMRQPRSYQPAGTWRTNRCLGRRQLGRPAQLLSS